MDGTTSKHNCTNIDRGIRFRFDEKRGGPMRFNRQGENVCHNYHPDYLQNLAKAIGYRTYRVDYKSIGNSCKLAYIDNNGKFKSISGDTSIKKPYDVSFWN